MSDEGISGDDGGVHLRGKDEIACKKNVDTVERFLGRRSFSLE